jgi:hypothetical protein
MKFIITFLLCAGGLLFASSSSQGSGWRGIVPLHSTRADVERLIGKPNFKYDLYDFENERVNVMYSGDPCTAGLQGSYNVPRDTVISIDVAPKQKLMLSDLNIDLKNYRKTIDSAIEVHSFYRNEEEGITIGTFEGGGEDNGKVLKIYYGPAAKDSQLRCSAATTQQAAKADGSRATQINSSTGPIGDPCPTISMVGPSGVMCRGQRYSFSATLAGVDPRFSPTYKWSVSAGTIISGQGTYAIEVDASSAGGKPITATLEVGGVIPEGCKKVECYTTECPRPNATVRR